MQINNTYEKVAENANFCELRYTLHNEHTYLVCYMKNPVNKCIFTLPSLAKIINSSRYLFFYVCDYLIL